MWELLSDTWRAQEEEQKCCHQRRSQRRGPVTDIMMWTECFASMVAILSTKYPEKTGQFMAYLRTIVKAQRTFSGEGWVTYDSCYRRKAAITKSLDWGTIDFTLYNETFAGRAKAISRCRYCLSELHPSGSCIYAPMQETFSNTGTARQQARPPGAPICQLYNTRGGNRCNFSPCKFAHICSDCRGNHPLSSCRKPQPPPAKMPRPDSPTYRSKR